MAKDAVATLFDSFTAYQRTEVIRAAITLELFTVLGAGAKTAEELAGACKAAPRGMRILSDTLCALGLLRKNAGRYSNLAELQPFLDRTSPMYAGSVVKASGKPSCWPISVPWAALVSAISRV